jgi:hypothetical protein
MNMSKPIDMNNNKSCRPFGLRFLEIPANQLAEAGGGRHKRPIGESPVTEAVSMAGEIGRPDTF